MTRARCEHQRSEIERLLQQRFPEIAVAPLRQVEIGFGSIVFETSDKVIFRIARHATAAEGHAREAKLLPVLQERVSVAVPDPRWRIDADDEFPHGAIGYQRLPGTPLAPESLARIGRQQIASQLGAFLAALHRFPVEDAEALGLPHADRDPDVLVAFRDRVLPPLRNALGHDEYRAVCAWWDAFLSDPLMQQFAPTVRHGDLWYDHILVNEQGRLVGVVDWEAAAIGDPARDFAAQFHLGESFAQATLSAYRTHGGQANGDLGHRVVRQWELREFGGIDVAVALNDHEEFEDLLRKLRAGPILSRTTTEP